MGFSLGKPSIYYWLVVFFTPLKNRKVNWDDEIPNIWEKMFQTTNQFMLINVQMIRNIPNINMGK